MRSVLRRSLRLACGMAAAFFMLYSDGASQTQCLSRGWRTPALQYVVEGDDLNAYPISGGPGVLVNGGGWCNIAIAYEPDPTNPEAGWVYFIDRATCLEGRGGDRSCIKSAPIDSGRWGAAGSTVLNYGGWSDVACFAYTNGLLYWRRGGLFYSTPVNRGAFRAQGRAVLSAPPPVPCL